MNHTELVDSIADALRPRGEGDVDVAALRAGTMARVRSARRRRIAVAAAGVVAAVAVTVTVEPQLTAGRVPETGAPPNVSANRSSPRAAALPAANVPGAAQRPDTVGTDRAVLHFDVDLAAFGGTGALWETEPGRERVSVWTGSGTRDATTDQTAKVVISQTLDRAQFGGMTTRTLPPNSPAPVTVTVAGRPGKIQAYPGGWEAAKVAWVLWWQPADGVWAEVTMDADDAGTVVAAAATGIHLDRSQRCAVPIRVGAVPAGTEWENCMTVMAPAGADGRSWQAGSLEFRGPRGDTLILAYGDIRDWDADGDKYVPNRIVRGRPAMWFPSGPGHQLAVPDTGGRNLFVSMHGENVTEQDAVALAEGATFSDDLVDLDTWPKRPVG
ncbi:hypothetical protein GCM10009827_009130 [Dactylosporangium maewongense]|uniref:Uncharacterized protein n=1 Tax=Dactylosporangium maewongense TaxID=634393 RepID=A0ABN1ZMD9_9ACTN